MDMTRHDAYEVLRQKKREAYDEYVRIRDESKGKTNMNDIRSKAWKEVKRKEAEATGEYHKAISLKA